MAVIIDGTTGVATPGVTDTGNLSVAGTTTLTTPLPVASGGTGATSLSGLAVGNLAGGSAGTIPYQSTVGTTAMLATGTSGQALISAGPTAAPAWGTPSAATNLAGGSVGTVPYQTASGATSMLSAGTSGQFLQSNGAAAPSWATLAINQSTLVADGAVTAAGKALILTAAGKVKQSAIATASTGASTIFNAAKTGMAAVVYHPIADVFIIAYLDSTDSSKGKAKIATVASNNTVTFSSAFTFYNTAIYAGSMNACYDPVTNQVLIAFTEGANNYGAVITATVSGSTLTFGTATNTGVAGYEVGISYDTGVSKFLLNYRNASAQAVVVGTVTGTSVSFGSPTTVIGSGSNGYGAPAVYCPSISRHCIGYNTGGRGYIQQVTIAPTTFAITLGSAVAITNGSGADGYLSGNHSLTWVDSLQRLLVVHSGGPSSGYYLQVTMFVINTTSWSYTAYTNVDTNSYSAPYQWWPGIDYSASSGYAVLSYVNASSQTGYVTYSSALAASSISFGTKTQFQATATDMTSVAAGTVGTRSLVIAWDNTNPTPSADLNGTCAGSTSPIADSRTSFIGFSVASASDGASVSFTTSFGVNTNQSGLTPNTTYYLSSSDGTTLTTTVDGPKVARALSATSVQVLGPNCA